MNWQRFFKFFNTLNIMRSRGKKYGLIGNFKTFKKMWLLPTDIETQRRRKIFSIFPYFALFFLTGLILYDRTDKNMNWWIISRPFGKYNYFNQYLNPATKKKNFNFSLFFFNFFNRFNIIPSGGLKYGLIGKFKSI